MNKDSEAKGFKRLEFDDKDLVMFTITDLRLEKSREQVHVVINLKRKIQTEILTTYLPTLLLLISAYTTTFFKPIFFEASLTVNLTIMLVMTTIFTSKIEELPPTSDTKMIDIWLIFCLLVPFAFTLVQTAIECFREDASRQQVRLHEEVEGVDCDYVEQEMSNATPVSKVLVVEKAAEGVVEDQDVVENQGALDQTSSSSVLERLQWAG